MLAQSSNKSFLSFQLRNKKDIKTNNMLRDIFIYDEV